MKRVNKTAAQGDAPLRRPGSGSSGIVAPRPAPCVAPHLADALYHTWTGEEAALGLDTSLALLGALPLAVTDERLLGALGKCAIRGCDVHFLTLQDRILRHVEATESMPQAFASARKYWESPHEAAVAVLVFERHGEILLLDGTRLPLPSFPR